ncbi:transporter substrate-binding domain-containing protein [Desulfobacterales bacterium HSG17]|nr:transporter substrate-binding domain-containing protein [Desulfobacterales bacterium HSG17]
MKKTSLLIAVLCIILSGRVFAEQIIFTSTGSYPPVSFKEGDKMSGINVEIIKEVLKRAGHEPVYKIMPFKRGLHSLKKGEVTATPGLFYTAERSEFLNYCREPLCSAKIGIFSLKGSGIKVDKLEDLKGKSVAVMRNNSYGPEFDNYKGIKRVIRNSYREQAEILNRERTNMAVAEELPFYYYSGKSGIRDRFEMVYVLSEEFVYVAFSKAVENSARLSEEFCKNLRQMKKEGLVADIIEKYK